MRRPPWGTVGRRARGRAEVVAAHLPVEPTRDEDLRGRAPWGIGGPPREPVHGGGRKLVGREVRAALRVQDGSGPRNERPAIGDGVYVKRRGRRGAECGVGRGRFHAQVGDPATRLEVDERVRRGRAREVGVVRA